MNQLRFTNRLELRKWLSINALSEEGVWMVLSKEKPTRSITAREAKPKKL